jgi:nicotinate phosphoribosyltransferase
MLAECEPVPDRVGSGRVAVAVFAKIAQQGELEARDVGIGFSQSPQRTGERMAIAIQTAKRVGRSKALKVLTPGSFKQRTDDIEPAVHDFRRRGSTRDMPISAFSTDLYQLTMMAGYFERKMLSVRATFELFVRRLPANRSFLVCAGLEQVLDYLEGLSFTDEEIAWLRAQPSFSRVSSSFFDYLRTFRFSGDVWAMREGTPFFPMEPILRVTAPIAEAQLIETAALAIINFQTTIASKAARIVQAAAGRPVMEFGARRAHGLEAASFAARAAYLGGGNSTSYVQAGRAFGIPVTGTMAHSWILAASSEIAAFTSYADLFGANTVLLIDTFDIDAATRMIIDAGLRPHALRIDSGDLLAESRRVRAVLDQAGLTSTQIVVSGDLDEWKIASLVDNLAPIDTFAVGTALSTSDDAPALGGVYKIVQLEEHGAVRSVMKRSEGKGTWPGAKQVWRFGKPTPSGDTIALADEAVPVEVIPLLEPVMRGGERVSLGPPLDAIRTECLRQIKALPDDIRTLKGKGTYPVEPSRALAALAG